METETKTDNELIAEFDGWTHKPTPKGKGKGLWNRVSKGQAAFSSSAFRYDTSWDWLMPVVEKIENLHSVRIGYYLNIHITQGYVKIDGVGEKILFNTSIERF